MPMGSHNSHIFPLSIVSIVLIYLTGLFVLLSDDAGGVKDAIAAVIEFADHAFAPDPFHGADDSGLRFARNRREVGEGYDGTLDAFERQPRRWGPSVGVS